MGRIWTSFGRDHRDTGQHSRYGKHVVGSRLGLFILDFLLLVALDFPFRLPFYRTLLSSATSGEINSFSPWLTTSDLLYIGILAGLTWILIFTIVPLLTYLLIAIAKCLFDLSVGWLADCSRRRRVWCLYGVVLYPGSGYAAVGAYAARFNDV